MIQEMEIPNIEQEQPKTIFPRMKKTILYLKDKCVVNRGKCSR